MPLAPVPISCILTSASLHDSQAAIPLALTTAQRVTNLYDLSDSAYDAPAIHEQIRSLGHIPIVDANPRRDAARKAELQADAQRKKLLNFICAEDVCYRERTTVEWVNARLKRRVRRTHDPRAGQRQGDVPSYVWYRCIGRRPDPATDHVDGTREDKTASNLEGHGRGVPKKRAAGRYHASNSRTITAQRRPTAS